MAKRNNRKNAKPETGNGRLQTFSLAAPAATSVELVGDFTHWQQQPVRMQKAADGTWRARVPLTPGTHPYRFLVDGQWRNDPACGMRVANAYGGQNAVCQVP